MTDSDEENHNQIHCTCGESVPVGGFDEHKEESDGESEHEVANSAGNVPEKEDEKRAKNMNPDDRIEDKTPEESPINDEQSMKNEAGAVMSGRDPLDNLNVKRTGLNTYSVLSLRNGSVSIHEVTLSGQDCTCKDFEYDDSGTPTCAHLVAAHLHATDVDASDVALAELTDLMVESRQLRDEAQEALHNASEANVSARDAQAHAKQQASDEASNGSQESSAEKAAERLQSAYDDVVPDMGVQAHNGMVFIQTGQDTPDTIPGPGNVDTWEAFLKNPSQVKYLPPDENDTPGEWWKNAIDPSDVESYISEVLE